MKIVKEWCEKMPIGPIQLLATLCVSLWIAEVARGSRTGNSLTVAPAGTTAAPSDHPLPKHGGAMDTYSTEDGVTSPRNRSPHPPNRKTAIREVPEVVVLLRATSQSQQERMEITRLAGKHFTRPVVKPTIQQLETAAREAYQKAFLEKSFLLPREGELIHHPNYPNVSFKVKSTYEDRLATIAYSVMIAKHTAPRGNFKGRNMNLGTQLLQQIAGDDQFAVDDAKILARIIRQHLLRSAEYRQKPEEDQAAHQMRINASVAVILKSAKDAAEHDLEALGVVADYGTRGVDAVVSDLIFGHQSRVRMVASVRQQEGGISDSGDNVSILEYGTITSVPQQQNSWSRVFNRILGRDEESRERKTPVRSFAGNTTVGFADNPTYRYPIPNMSPPARGSGGSSLASNESGAIGVNVQMNIPLGVRGGAYANGRDGLGANAGATAGPFSLDVGAGVGGQSLINGAARFGIFGRGLTVGAGAGLD